MKNRENFLIFSRSKSFIETGTPNLVKIRKFGGTFLFRSGIRSVIGFQKNFSICWFCLNYNAYWGTLSSEGRVLLLKSFRKTGFFVKLSSDPFARVVNNPCWQPGYPKSERKSRLSGLQTYNRHRQLSAGYPDIRIPSESIPNIESFRYPA